MRLLLVEDDPMIASGLSLCLSQADFGVVCADTAEKALVEVARADFDVAVFDLRLPGLNGIELIRRLRAQGKNWPILILTACDALEDRVQGLDAGADDYMIKPVQAPELFARLRVLLRRSKLIETTQLTYGRLCMDLAHRTVETVASGDEVQRLDIGPREWLVLECLLRSVPKAVSKDALLRQMAGGSCDITPNAVEVYVSRLRPKLGCAGVTIRHVRGLGYQLSELAEVS